jgi:hypothetical protein
MLGSAERSAIGGVPMTGGVAARRWPPPDGTCVQGRDADTVSPVAVLVGGARVEFATMAELAGFPGGHAAQAVPLRLFRALPTRICDGTLVQGTVDVRGRVDLTPVALLAGGARVAFTGPEALVACGFGQRPVWPIPSRVYRALPVVPGDGTLLRPAGGGDVYRISGGCGRRLGPGCVVDVAAVWVVPDSEFDRLTCG